MADSIFKTKLCNWHWDGRCSRGTQCKYAHSLADLKPLPDGLTKAPFQYYDGVHMPAPKEVRIVLAWARRFNRDQNLEMPRWANDLVWDLGPERWLRSRSRSRRRIKPGRGAAGEPSTRGRSSSRRRSERRRRRSKEPFSSLASGSESRRMG